MNGLTAPVNARTILGCRLVLLVTVLSVHGLWLLSPSVHAQRTPSPLEIGDMGHTVVNDRSVIVVALSNTGRTALSATGEFTLVNVRGDEVGGTLVSTGIIGARDESVVAIPLDVLLPPGRYTATLSLEDDDEGVRVDSGLREIVVQGFSPESTSEPVVATPPPAVEDDASGRGFPSWLLLLIGLTLTIIGMGYMRMSSGQRKPPPHRPVPEVSMVRKVNVASRPAKRPATIKPLVPPHRRKQ